jgi:hypothetical protein
MLHIHEQAHGLIERAKADGVRFDAELTNAAIAATSAQTGQKTSENTPKAINQLPREVCWQMFFSN